MVESNSQEHRIGELLARVKHVELDHGRLEKRIDSRLDDIEDKQDVSNQQLASIQLSLASQAGMARGGWIVATSFGAILGVLIMAAAHLFSKFI